MSFKAIIKRMRMDPTSLSAITFAVLMFQVVLDMRVIWLRRA
jgi:hypothetical protein